MAASVRSLNANDYYILFCAIETFVCDYSILQNKLEKRKNKDMWFNLFCRDKTLQR